jgi:hypothetical protein
MRTDMTQLIVAFRNFVHESKNESVKDVEVIIIVSSEIHIKHINSVDRMWIFF